MKKKLLIFLLCVPLVITGCGDLFKTPDPPSIVPSQTYGQIGCVGMSYATAQSWGNVGNTLNNVYYDQKMTEEVIFQGNFWRGIPAYVYILYETDAQHKNAYAVQQAPIILFGYYMFYYSVLNYGELAAAGILAHEWGHRIQYTFNWIGGNPLTELEADSFSGYYMALGKLWAWSQIQGYYANVYTTGDYMFNHPQHHGTPQQRVAAAYLGVQTALYAIQNQKVYTPQELHQIFTAGITSSIAPMSALTQIQKIDVGVLLDYKLTTHLNESDISEIAIGKTTGAEIVYPIVEQKNLEKLFPHF